MSSERFVQDKLFEEKELPPKQEFDHYYGWATYEQLDQPLKDMVDEDYYIITKPVKLNIYPSQFKYVDNNFAIVTRGGETTVLTREDWKEWYGPFLNSDFLRNKTPVINNVWVDGRDIVFNPNVLKDLRVLEGKRLEKSTREEVGGKSLGLVELKPHEHIGYKVPDFIVVPTSFYDALNIHGFEGRAEEIMSSYSSAEDIINKDGLSHEGAMDYVPRKINDLFKSLNVYESMFVPYILPNIKRLYLDNHEPDKHFEIIVRSSSPLEDGNENLFQGVFLSSKANFYIDDRSGYSNNEDVYEAIENVMLSSWSVTAESYLRNRKLIGKVSRSMAEIIQVVPNDIVFVGRSYIDNGKIEIEYLDEAVSSGDYVGNRIYVQEGEITKRVDDVKDYGLRKIGNFGELMSNEKAIEISQVMEKLSIVFPKFDNQFNIEFGVSKEGVIYLFQMRPTKRIPMGGTLPDLSQIDRNKILFECSEYNSPFSIGKIVGPVVNLLKYEYGYQEENNDEFFKEIAEFDKKYPGSIFIVRLNIPGVKNVHMLTPNKKGIIVCYEHDHFTRNDHCVEELYRDPTFHIINVLPELFRGLKTGERLGIVSTGEKAVFYTPDSSEPDSIIFEPPTILERSNYFSRYGEYIQGDLPLDK